MDGQTSEKLTKSYGDLTVQQCTTERGELVDKLRLMDGENRFIEIDGRSWREMQKQVAADFVKDLIVNS